MERAAFAAGQRKRGKNKIKGRKAYGETGEIRIQGETWSVQKGEKRRGAALWAARRDAGRRQLPCGSRKPKGEK
ncbi:hypothetical protein ACFX13_041459 [Malus domestica]